MVARDTTRPAPGTGGGVDRNLVSGALLGLGTVAFIDEAIFHQLLHWHHFYDRSTDAAGLVSDGLFHAFSFFATVAALFLFADLRRRGLFRRDRWLGAFLVGVGAFQLYDGLVQHKVFGLHEIRYGVDLAPYDIAWNAIAAAVLVAGLVVLGRSGRADPVTGAHGSGDPGDPGGPRR